MGLDINGTRFLLYARQEGVDFSRTAMIGRQSLNLSATALRQNLRDFGMAVPAEETERLMLSEDGYAEPFLRLLGATQVVSFDASDYERATCIHDFNLPLDERYFGRFSVVLDGGTLEHIFNFPQAISNCMQMLDAGGHFLGITPANNFAGHGFYQFSPELYFRVFSPSNGFTVRQMLAFESPTAKWYEVADPLVAKQRVTLVSRRETYLLVIAQKRATVLIFANSIQQSDYLDMWESNMLPPPPPPQMAAWRSVVPAPLKTPIRAARNWLRSYRARPRFGSDRRHFRRIRVPQARVKND